MSTMRTVVTNLRAARTAIKDMGRLRQIAAVLIRHGFGQVVEAWNLQDKVIVGALLEKRDPEAPRKGLNTRIVEATQELGPTFVKLGQILSTRSDLIPQALCDELATLQDSVAPITFAEAKAVVEAALKCPLEDVFSEFSEEPLASASIAQVHTARLKSNGEEVVVKVQRPGIRQTIESDLHILHWVARQIEVSIPEAQAFDPVAIALEFERAISKELDFTFEANNLERFDRNFAAWPSIHIPRVHRECSSRTILVMERLRGKKITEAAPLGFDMEAIARECVSMIFKMVFEDGFFHGDLHPGNLFVLEDGRIGLIDFGLVGRMTQVMKDAMADLLLHLATRNHAGVARALFEIAIRTGKVDYGRWEAEVSELMDVHLADASLAEVDFGEILRALVEGAIRHNVRIPADYTMFFKAIMTVEGIGKIVAPDLDLLSECRPHVERLIAARYSPERVLRASVDTLQAFARFARQFPVSAHEFLRSIEDGRINVGLDFGQLEKLERARDRRLNRAVLAGLTAAFLFCGVLLRHDARWTVFGVPGLSLLAFIVGGYLSFRLFWRIRKEDW
ncbi:MAG: AarF/ABC1/UbiB kinase family protein [Myxococcales bacterium]|nr:AarF/ABC1/UbiB kinase family protein [Myxococcales bacterium]